MIAIIGLPGAGKTYTLKKLKKLGFSILITDCFFKNQYLQGNESYERIKKAFGNEYVDENGVIIKKIRNLAMKKIELIEKEVHPILEKHLITNKYDFVEIPIIDSKFANFRNLFSYVVNITRPENIRKKCIKRMNVDKSFFQYISIKNKRRNSVYDVDILSGNYKKITDLIIKKHK